MVAFRLATIHNLTYYMTLMKTIRKNIELGSFSKWADTFLSEMIKHKGM